MTAAINSTLPQEVSDFGNGAEYHQEFFPPNGYKPDREQSITKVIHVGEFEPGDDTADIKRIRQTSDFFREALMGELDKRGGTGIGDKFDLNYQLMLHIVEVPKGEIRDHGITYHVYVEADYPRDTGSWVSQIRTRNAFNEALDAATQKVKDEIDNKFDARILHIGMTGRFPD